MSLEHYDWFEAPRGVVEIFDECVARAEAQRADIENMIDEFGASGAFGRHTLSGLSFDGEPPKNWRRAGEGRSDGGMVPIYLPAKTSKQRKVECARILSTPRPNPQRDFGERMGGGHMEFSGSTVSTRYPHLTVRRYLGIPKGYPADRLKIPADDLQPVRLSDVMRAIEDAKSSAGVE